MRSRLWRLRRKFAAVCVSSRGVRTRWFGDLALRSHSAGHHHAVADTRSCADPAFGGLAFLQDHPVCPQHVWIVGEGSEPQAYLLKFARAYVSSLLPPRLP